MDDEEAAGRVGALEFGRRSVQGVVVLDKYTLLQTIVCYIIFPQGCTVLPHYCFCTVIRIVYSR